MEHTTSTEAVGKLAEARSLIAAAWAEAADADLPAGHAAYFALLVEQLGQEFARAQLFAADLLRRTGAHQLDADSFQAIADAGAQPSAEDLARAAGRTTMGRTPYKNTVGLLHNWLGIPLGTVRDRLAQADCLIAQVTTAGHRAQPLLPQLAAEFTAPRSDPRLVLSASRLIHGAQKDFGPGPAGERARAGIQAEAVALIREQPATARKHVADLIHQLKSGKRPLGALLSEIGLFKLGRRKGLENYLLRLLPSQAEVLDAHLRKVDNPKTEAGNREELHRQAAEDLAAENGDPDGWDNSETMPDWAQDPEAAAAEAEDPDHEDPGHEDPGPDDPDAAESTQSQPEPGGEAAGDEPPAASAAAELLVPFEDMRPELRHLMGLLATLKSTGTGKRQGAAAEVGIIIDYDKMLEAGQDFAVTITGKPISAGEARAALCNAGIYPVVLNGRDRILNLGRSQRLFSKSQAKALRIARRGCAFPGCTMPAERCEIDHLDAWEKGGRTDIDLGDLYCTVHHIGRHCGLFHAVKVEGSRPMVLLPKSVDPEQRLHLNTHFLTPAESKRALAWAAEATQLWKAGKLKVTIAEA
ncbi:HNH endonuclease signature motif containing protein [Glutamicibacter protophormiae]|uniref:HNH endonuclease signature motif containing protein n=1 Tax=Glutamicibacter protophormiae TaxID=37930 RepID=UPI003A916264